MDTYNETTIFDSSSSENMDYEMSDNGSTVSDSDYLVMFPHLEALAFVGRNRNTPNESMVFGENASLTSRRRGAVMITF